MMRKILFVAFCALAVIACKKASGEYIDLDNVAVTGGVTDLTYTSATMTCYYNPVYYMKPDKCGVVGSTDPDPDLVNHMFSFSVNGSDIGSEHHFEINTLEPETRYYYRAFLQYTDLSHKDKRIYGEVLSFTTPTLRNVVSTEDPVVASSRAIISGTMVDLGHLPYEVWFILGKDGWMDDAKSSAMSESDGTFELMWGGLGGDSEYCYCAGVTVNDVDYVGEIKRFRLRKFVPSEGESIDMGLSVKWASCNVGASYPQDAGEYFAWGETAPRESYTWDNYIYKTEYPEQLSLDHDAAHVNMGGAWRMPTKEEFDELVDPSNTLYDWGDYNGKKGIMFFSRKNGESIFFPTAGYMSSSDIKEPGTEGHYRSSTRHGSWNNSYDMIFNASGLCQVECSDREYGHTVRGVCE